MSNPYLPKWEYIPDGEPRVFGDRVYVYGSHDRAGSDRFCDYVLKCYSAPLSDLNRWICHGDIFHTRVDRDHLSDTPWTKENNELYAPDVVEKDGKYYLYAYIVGAIGCVAVADRPEGPFTLVSQYKYTVPDAVCCNGWFIDPGVLVDDDGRVYIYCGFERSFMAEVNAENMYEIIDGSCIEHIIPCGLPQGEGDNAVAGTPTVPGMPVARSHGFTEEESLFFEACSPRKINGIYYLIYSPKRGSRLAYATAEKPTGPFTYRGYIVVLSGLLWRKSMRKICMRSLTGAVLNILYRAGCRRGKGIMPWQERRRCPVCRLQGRMVLQRKKACFLRHVPRERLTASII